MTDDTTRRYKEDDPDELWDDDLRIASGSVVKRDSEEDIDRSGDQNREYNEDNGNSGDLYAKGSEIYDDSYEDSFEDDYEDAEDEEAEEPDNIKEDTKPRRRKIFGISADDDVNDYFDNDADPEKEPIPEPKPKRVIIDPEDPDYWMEDESDFDHIIPKPKKKWIWWAVGVVIIIGFLAGLWIWFLTPHTDGAVKYGYIKSMERHGTFIKTYEGILIPYRELGDSTPTYFEEIRFSVDGDSLAAHMKGMMLNCIPVRLEYERYHSPLFWKGSETMVIVKADTADVRKILPPEYR